MNQHFEDLFLNLLSGGDVIISLDVSGRLCCDYSSSVHDVKMCIEASKVWTLETHLNFEPLFHVKTRRGHRASLSSLHDGCLVVPHLLWWFSMFDVFCCVEVTWEFLTTAHLVEVEVMLNGGGCVDNMGHLTENSLHFTVISGGAAHFCA